MHVHTHTHTHTHTSRTAVMSLMLCQPLLRMCVIYCVLHKLNPDFECVVILQNCMAYSSTEKRLMLGDDGDQVVGVQVDGATVIKEEENPISVKVEEVTLIKEEPEPIKLDEVTVIKEEGDQLETTSREIDNESLVT